MIKISFRDKLADLPPSILKKRIKEIDERNNTLFFPGKSTAEKTRDYLSNYFTLRSRMDLNAPLICDNDSLQNGDILNVGMGSRIGVKYVGITIKNDITIRWSTSTSYTHNANKYKFYLDNHNVMHYEFKESGW